MDFSTPPAPIVAALADATEEQLIAVMEVMHFIAKADGFLSADELRQFLKFAKTVCSDKIDSSQLSALVSGWGKRKVDDVPARLATLSQILESDSVRRAAYDLASKMAAADGQLEDAEMKVLEQIEEALRID